MKKVIEMSIEDKRFIFDTTFNTILVALIELEKTLNTSFSPAF